MNNPKVLHKFYGEGVVTGINGDYISVLFASGTKKDFQLVGFDKFFSFDDIELAEKIETATKEKTKAEIKAASEQKEKAKEIRKVFPKREPVIYQSEISSMLLGPRSETIYVKNDSQMFELVGYIAAPGRVKSFEAEVPRDGRDKIFEEHFPGQTYRPIELGYTPSGMPNKVAPQFRINFLNTDNCPDVLKPCLRAGNSSCVARINRSRFVLTLVQHYGFQFGDYQDIERIRNIAISKGHLDDFNNGYQL